MSDIDGIRCPASLVAGMNLCPKGVTDLLLLTAALVALQSQLLQTCAFK